MIALAIGWGCHGDSVDSPVGIDAVVPARLFRASVNASCMTTSGQLSPGGSLVLTSSGSQAIYGPGLVPSPTTVTFSICDLDTSGTGMKPKTQVLGPLPNTMFTGRVTVRTSYADAGMIAGDPGNTSFLLFRQNEMTGAWHYYGMPVFRQTFIEYKVRHNGYYALGRGNEAWTVSRNVAGATENVLYLLNSRLVVPAGALPEPTEIQFTMASMSPTGIPGIPLGKVYEFGPDSTIFTSPVDAYISFIDAELGTNDPYLVRFYYLDESSYTWLQQQLPVVDTANGRFIVRLNHFSRYAFAR
jgi:hypothetical protein